MATISVKDDDGRIQGDIDLDDYDTTSSTSMLQLGSAIDEILTSDDDDDEDEED